MSTRPAVESSVGVSSRLPLIGLLLLLALLYTPILRDLVVVWSGVSHASHGFVIALWSAWVAWGSRAALRRARWAVEPSALVIVAVGVALLGVAEVRSSLTLAVLSLPVVLVGLGRFALGGEAFRPLLFPTAFLAFMAPLPPEAVPTLSLPLQQLAAAFSELVLAGLGIPATRDGLFIDLGPAIVHVAEGCSGLRFLLVMVVLGVGAAGAVERGAAARVSLFLLAIVGAIGANLVRVAGTVILVHLHGVSAAEGTFHSLFGKTLYLVALGSFLLTARALQPHRAPPAAFPSGRDCCEV